MEDAPASLSSNCSQRPKGFEDLHLGPPRAHPRRAADLDSRQIQFQWSSMQPAGINVVGKSAIGRRVHGIEIAEGDQTAIEPIALLFRLSECVKHGPQRLGGAFVSVGNSALVRVGLGCCRPRRS